MARARRQANEDVAHYQNVARICERALLDVLFLADSPSFTLERPPNAPLLVKSSGEPWKKSDHSRLFRRAAKAACQDPTEVTLYALRHSNVVRQILAGVPIRVVAVNHDTSIAMLERTYSRYIGDHSDALARGALLDTGTGVEGNVVQLRA
jgi:hypothetical protein